MNQTEIGKFIARCRKEQKLTQAQLAEKLNITDRAVSKWETGKCMPDSAIMLQLCEILGITVNELLSGEEIEVREKDGTFVCVICDLAIAKGLTWSLIPVSSVLLAWVILFPVMMYGKRGILGSCISVSIFIFPYLYVLSSLLQVREVLSIGGAASVISIVYLWLAVGIFKKSAKRKLIAAGIVFLLAVPFLFIMNGALSALIAEPLLDEWDVLTVFLLLIAAFTFFTCDYVRHK